MTYKQELIQKAVDVFAKHIGDAGEHAFITNDEKYQQPYVDITLHYVQMAVAGFEPDYDELIAVAGASALFGYKAGDFAAKYAHLDLKPEQRIAEATGFGYTWINMSDIENAWETIVKYIDEGKPLKGWDWENILFAGYQDAEMPDQRKVYAMADGPSTYSKWLSWAEFNEYYERIKNWGATAMGVHTEHVDVKPAKDVALQVINTLVKYSNQMPESNKHHAPDATYGLAGIKVYRDFCADVETYPDVVACHDLNPQWTTRNSTAVYLRKVVGAGLFSDEQNSLLTTAADQYRAAFECWEAYYRLLGHAATESARQLPARRAAGAAIVDAWLAHETAALDALKQRVAI